MTPRAMTVRLWSAAVATVALALGGTNAAAEPMFLSKQYNRCTACHYSTSGGQLTPYGRGLSRRELSTTGNNGAAPDAAAPQPAGEEAFLWGALGDRLGPLQLGIELRPAHLEYAFAGVPNSGSSRDLLMNADLIAAYQAHGWTTYGEVGRELTSPGWKIASYEHWAGYQSDSGIGVRFGRFLPAYGVHFADHTSFNRSYLGFDKYDQVYGLEVNVTTSNSATQVMLSPGRAESIINDDGRRAFTASARTQLEIGPRQVLVASGIYRNASVREGRSSVVGLSYGLSPWRRVTTWTEANAQFRQGSQTETSYIVVNETAIEAIRGVWFKVSPQLRTAPDTISGDTRRLALSTELLPRTHFNVNVSYYRDHNTSSQFLFTTWLAQFHLYL